MQWARDIVGCLSAAGCWTKSDPISMLLYRLSVVLIFRILEEIMAIRTKGIYAQFLGILNWAKKKKNYFGYNPRVGLKTAKPRSEFTRSTWRERNILRHRERLFLHSEPNSTAADSSFSGLSWWMDHGNTHSHTHAHTHTHTHTHTQRSISAWLPSASSWPRESHKTHSPLTCEAHTHTHTHPYIHTRTHTHTPMSVSIS